MNAADTSAADTSSAGTVQVADLLLRAAATGTPVPPVRHLLPEGDVASAYAVQMATAAHAVAHGRRVVGRKVGLTSVAVQQQLGVDQPDFGVLFADMARRSGEVIATTSLLQPRIEAEVAFLIGADLGTETTDTAVRAATRSVVAALEIVDSRIAGWDISLVDTVADNASCGLFVLGTDPVELGDLDLREVTMSMIDRSGATVSLGTGADCLDDPVAAVAWLATTMKELGTPLRAGDVVLSGALGPMVAVTAGSSFRADLSGLGTVSVTFSDVVGTGVAGAAR